MGWHRIWEFVIVSMIPGGRSGGPKVTLAECFSMQRNVARNSLFIVIALLLICGSLLAISVAARAEQNSPKVLNGQIAPLVAQAQLLQAATPGQQLNLSLGLQPRNAAALNSLLSSLYDPQSPQYHQYLTPDQFEALFAPTPDSVQQVVSYLQSAGMTVTSIALNNLLIDATSNVAQADQAFSTTINNYQLGSQVFYANATPPVVPAAISSLIASIGGLDNSTQYQPLYRRIAGKGQLAKLANGPTSGYGPKISRALIMLPHCKALACWEITRPSRYLNWTATSPRMLHNTLLTMV